MDEVPKTVLVSPEVKVLLLVMGMRMDDAGRYSVPREELAAALGCHPRKVTEKQKAAIDAGLLIRTVQGRRAGPAEFQASVPGDSGTEVRVPTVGTLTSGQGADGRHPNQTDQVNRVPTTSTLTPTPKGADGRHPNADIGCRPSAPKPTTEQPAPYKDRAGAHSDADRSDPTADVSGDAGEAVVIALFEGKTTPSLRSKKHTARERAEPEPIDAFDAFWRTYPRRVGKGAARKAWAKALKNGGDAQQIIIAARRFSTDPRRVEADIKYTPHPATWLNQERWDDEPEPEYVPAPVVDRRQQAIDDQYARQLERARALDAMEAPR